VNKISNSVKLHQHQLMFLFKLIQMHYLPARYIFLLVLCMYLIWAVKTNDFSLYIQVSLVICNLTLHDFVTVIIQLLYTCVITWHAVMCVHSRLGTVGSLSLSAVLNFVQPITFKLSHYPQLLNWPSWANVEAVTKVLLVARNKEIYYPWEKNSELVWTQRLEEYPLASARDRTLIARFVVRHCTDWATQLRIPIITMLKWIYFIWCFLILGFWCR
jgi:hypothetical protein